MKLENDLFKQLKHSLKTIKPVGVTTIMKMKTSTLVEQLNKLNRSV